MSSLSVVLATFNEEKNLPSCLDSIKDIADEIIIVDGTSLDKTVEIAKKYGAKVKVTTNKPNFHINKQMAIDMATKDWILQLDADEHISAEQKQEIKQILENDSKQYNGYWMPRKNWFLGRFLMKGGQYPDYTLRLYRNGKGKLPQKDVHEQAVVDGKVGYLKSALLHYPYKDFAFYLNKWNRYNILFAEQIKDEQKNKNIFQKLFYAFAYLLLKPAHWFFTTYFRHKGFVDGWQGFTFSLFSALRFPASYIKYVGFYKFSVFLIILISAVVRFWSYPQRWGLGGDDARDAMIALEAIKRHQVPLTGSFSSAGPFVFGPIFYWFIMLSYLIYPFYIGSPWIMMEIVSLLTVGLLIYLGKILLDKKFSIILGVLAMLSPQLIFRSLALGQHSFVVPFTILTLIAFLLFWKKKKLIFPFLMGLFIGVALSMHYQAINLFIFFPAIFFIFGLSLVKRIYSFLLSITGFLIPTLPLLYWDSFQGFSNIKNILDYFLIAEYRIYVPNSWRLFIFKDFPSYWSFVVGNFSIIGFLLFISSILLFIFLLIRQKISKEFSLIGLIFLFLIFINRFYRGERSEGYLLYFLPFILIFTSFLIYKIFCTNLKYFKQLAILITGFLILSNLIYVKNVLNFKSQRSNLQKVVENLIIKYPNTKFSFYDYKYKFYTDSMAISLIASFKNVSDINGRKIGFICYGKKSCPLQNLKIINKSSFFLVDLSNSIDFNHTKGYWVNVNQPQVFDDLVGWLNKHQLKSSFNLKKYIMERV